MNKKFFTLIASVLLLAGLVGTANAQSMTPGTVKNSFGTNDDQKLYQLSLNKGGSPTTAPTLTKVLIMKANGDLALAPYANYYDNGNTIGQSLWCVSKATTFDGSLGVNFSFTNKAIGKYFRLSEDLGVDVNVDKGFNADWGFSGTIPAIETNFPLYSYYGTAGRVMLLMYGDILGRGDTLYVATLPYSEFIKGTYSGSFTSSLNVTTGWSVPGLVTTAKPTGFPTGYTPSNDILWATLTTPAPKVLTAADFNTKLGTVASAAQQIKFSLDNNNVSQSNPWSTNALKAVSFAELTAKTADDQPDTTIFTTSAGVNTANDWIAFSKDGGKNEWLRVDTAYSTNGSTTQYLTFNFSEKYPFGITTTGASKDTIPEGQYLFRLKYDISADEIFFDVAQITHNRLGTGKWKAAIAHNLGQYDGTIGGAIGTGVISYDVNDNLMGTAASDYTSTLLPTTTNVMLRVALVDIDSQSAARLVTLNNIGFAKTVGKLNITSCTAAAAPDYTSVDEGLYTITTDLQIFGVPINTDTIGTNYKASKHPAVFYNKDGIYNAEYTPSAQWIVKKKRSSAASTSPILLINREFPNIIFDNIQLVTGKNSINSNYEGLVFKFENFKKVSTALAKQETLGYLYLDKYQKAGSYSLQYYHNFDNTRYLGIDKDSRIRIAQTQGQFKLTPVSDELVAYGYKPSADEAKNFVQLKRVAYGITNGKYTLQIDKDLKTYTAVDTTTFKAENTIKGLTNKGVFLIKTYNVISENGDDKLYYALLDTNSFYARAGYKAEAATIDTFNSAGIADYGTAVAGGAANDNAALRINYVKLSISDGSVTAYANVQGESRTSAFHIGLYSEPLYRRFDGGKYIYGNGKEETTEDFKGDSADVNSPLWLKFHDMNLTDMYLYENSTGNKFRSGLTNKNLSFLGIQDIVHYAEGKEEFNKPYYQFYVDTAFVKRSADGKAGPKVNASEYTAMPQYMLAVRPIIMPEGKIWVREGNDIFEGLNPPVSENDPSWGQWKGYDVKRLTRGYYVFNAQDSVNVGNADYAGKKEDNITDDVRLAFVDGVHYGDTFYVIAEKYPYDAATTSLMQRNPELYLKNLPATRIHDLSKNTHYVPRYAKSGSSYTVDATKNGKSMVFQFRLRNLQQLDGGNPTRNFFIESEVVAGDEIGPDKAKFVNNHNGAPVISQPVEFIGNAAINDAALGINVSKTEGDNYGKPEYSANEAATLSDDAKVIGGVNKVSVLNAAGKTVTVTNVLGQTVAKTVLSSDNATIALPKGIVVVTVDGKSTKAVVK